MARLFRDVSLAIDGQTYRLVFDVDTMILVEEQASTPEREVSFQEVQVKALRGHIRYSRLVFWACLQRHHPQITLAQAGELMSHADDLDRSMAEALRSAAPDPKDLKELGVKKPRRPRKAQTA